MAELERRVDTLEEALRKLISVQQKTEREIQALKDEMREFKNEIQNFKDEMRREAKRINKQWGELANKMGTIVEDIVFPAVRPVLKKYFKCDPEILMMNVERKRNGRREEWDVIAVSEDKVFLIEVKSSLRTEHINMLKEKAKRLIEYFPEYRGKELVLILASLRIPEERLTELTKAGIYAMAYREWEYLDILNFKEVQSLKTDEVLKSD